jgi:Uma2 family endonuclease
MNAPFVHQNGLPHRAFTVADVYRMVEVGLLGPDERVELIEGALVPMASKGARHVGVQRALLRAWRARLAEIDLLFKPTLRLSEHTYFEPDIVAVSRALPTKDLAGPTVLLAIAIADLSLGYDLGVKPAHYARYGVRELWVIDVNERQVHVHRDPGEDGYREVRKAERTERVVPLHAPELALSLADLDVT